MKYIASSWQREFHSSTVDEMLGGGSAGPGKSMALLMDPGEQIVVEHARCEAGETSWGRSTGWALHLRREFPRLEQSIHRSKLLFTGMDAAAKYDAATHKWRFSSGYQYQFGHLKENDSFLNYRSNEYSFLGIDELGEIESKDQYDELVLRVRSTDPVLSKMLKVRATSNPWGNWVRDYFVDPAPVGRKIIVNRVRLNDGSYAERTRMYLPALLSDNPDPSFVKQYELNLQTKAPHIRAALLEGNWYIVAGSFFAEVFDPSKAVIKPFKIPPGWRRMRAGDWGWTQETAILWFAVSPDNELILYREMTFNGPKARQKLDAYGVAMRIREIEMENGEWDRIRNRSRLTGPMDTNLWSESGHRGMTMAHDMSRAGVNWFKASKGRRQCAQQVVKRLLHRGYNDRPALMIFEDCNRIIATLPALPTDKSTEANGESPLKCDYDHHYDALSYCCAANPMPSGTDDLPQRSDDEESELQGGTRFAGYL